MGPGETDSEVAGYASMRPDGVLQVRPNSVRRRRILQFLNPRVEATLGCKLASTSSVTCSMVFQFDDVNQYLTLRCDNRFFLVLVPIY